ncbi:divergent polysaccharide deacetylase family protein [Sulfitobacter delicatus]|uniref:Uncharacterized conserved protein YibQ, putative polysaccharide deacetylase 2 family n=1 Tax=Sulfitobacter delicatus TaxID=218672 RepID=A0A1G7QE26_9RHOB|nr:divergent polysaccharide deacetylase family protein [Sulfitobacter delicatus]SDF96791.1 Uncharacterized conserved protein YibQ, putative polysaccharide deacetylase 2 family [Sulfitobacter delicatus]
MARGFLSGLIWGGVASIGVVSAVSLMMPLPLPPQVGDAAPGSGPAPARIRLTDVAEQDRLPETPPASNRAVPRADAPEQDDLAAVDADAQTSAGLPETGGAEGLSTPADPVSDSPAQPGGEEPVLPNPQAVAPATPEPADELSISTEPAQPPAPEIAAVEGAFDAPAGMEAPMVVEDEAITLPAQEEVPEEIATSVAELEQPEVETSSGLTDDEEATAEVEVDVEADVDIEPAPETALRPPSEETLAEEGVSEEGGENPEATDAGPEAVTTGPTIGTPAISLTERDSGVVINRPGAAEVEEESTEVVTPDTPVDTRPVVTNSVPVEVADGKPLMGIVLIDDGSTVITGDAGLAALRSFPYPLSFAVDTSLPDLSERIATYRGAGFEVLAMVDLPEGAQPSDAETTFAATLDRIDGVVGVLEGTESGFQDSRAVADQVTDILQLSGLGLVTQDKGLNTMPKLARKDGVPADPVFRDFDSKGQTARVIRRFLDQAAFKAGQEGAVIMLGRLRPDTVSALLLWGLQDRANDVALVPISQVLLREE